MKQTSTVRIRLVGVLLGFGACWLVPAGVSAQVLFSENFDGLILGPSIDEKKADGSVYEGVWTAVPPAGWEIRNDICSIGDPTQGVQEWEGWSFCDPIFWSTIANDQNRSQFTKASGAIAVADPDEWDDKGNPDAICRYWSWLDTPPISLLNVDPNLVTITFDSSWRPEGPQKAQLMARFDGNREAELLYWESDSVSPWYHPDAENETLAIKLSSVGGIPQSGKYLRLSFAMMDAVNNWWWAIDNMVVSANGANPVGHRVSITGNPVVFENDPASQDVQIVLLTQPAGPVTITTDPNMVLHDVFLSSGTGIRNADGTVNLVFTPENWNLPQTIQVTAVNDTMPELRETGWLLFSADSESDPVFAVGHISTVIPVTIYSDDVGVIFAESENNTIVREGDLAADSYSVLLGTQPKNPVTLKVIADPKQVSLLANDTAGDSLVFTPGNWNQPQTVGVVAVDDTILETDPHFIRVSHAIETVDPGYAGAVVDDLTVEIRENECGAWGYLPSDFNQDCRVDLEDFAVICAQWVRCTMPHEEGCLRR